MPVASSPARRGAQMLLLLLVLHSHSTLTAAQSEDDMEGSYGDQEFSVSNATRLEEISKLGEVWRYP